MCGVQEEIEYQGLPVKEISAKAVGKRRSMDSIHSIVEIKLFKDTL